MKKNIFVSILTMSGLFAPIKYGSRNPIRRVCTLCLTAVLFCCILSLQSASQPCMSLSSPCVSTWSGAGFFFDMEALNKIEITQFNTFSQQGGSRTVKIYYRTGTYAGFETTPGAWTLVGTSPAYNPATAIACPIPDYAIPIPMNICMNAGARYGFYIVITSNSGGAATFESNASSFTTGSVASSDANLILYAGSAVFGQNSTTPFTGSLLNNMSFQGLIKYTCGCNSSSLNITVTSTNPLCNGQCTGTATATTAGGSPSYTYAWLPIGGSTSFATGLCAGTYSVTSTDSSGSTATATITITQPSVILLTASSTTTTCTASNGTATANLSGGTPGYMYLWNSFPNQTTQTATGLGAGTYTVTVTDGNNCTTTQTVTVFSSGSINTSQSASICYGASYTLPGSTVVSTGGVYIDTLASAAGCDSIIITTLTVDTVFTTSQSASVCSGSTYTLPGGTTVSTSGIYIDTLASVVGCDSIITTTLTVNPSPTATAFSSVTITQGQNVTLTANGGGTYSWNNGSNGSSITVTPLITTIYCVTVTDANNCTDTACVTVTIDPIDCSNTGEIYLPNAFSPNDDGENDKLQIYYGNIKCIQTFQLVIYNRWGEKVFQTTNPIAKWDGSYREKMEGTAVFAYYLEATLRSGERIGKKGNISLLR